MPRGSVPCAALRDCSTGRNASSPDTRLRDEGHPRVRARPRPASLDPDRSGSRPSLRTCHVAGIRSSTATRGQGLLPSPSALGCALDRAPPRSTPTARGRGSLRLTWPSDARPASLDPDRSGSRLSSGPATWRAPGAPGLNLARTPSEIRNCHVAATRTFPSELRPDLLRSSGSDTWLAFGAPARFLVSDLPDGSGDPRTSPDLPLRLGRSEVDTWRPALRTSLPQKGAPEVTRGPPEQCQAACLGRAGLRQVGTLILSESG